jgi:hypothetical protein
MKGEKENKMKPNCRNKLYAVAALASALMDGTLNTAAADPAPTRSPTRSRRPPYMSHPKETAKLIEEAATSARVNQKSQ